MNENSQCENCLQKPPKNGEELAKRFHEYVNIAFNDDVTSIKSIECDGYYKLVHADDGGIHCVYNKNTTFYQYCLMKDFMIYTMSIHCSNLDKIGSKLIMHITAMSDFLLPAGYYLPKTLN